MWYISFSYFCGFKYLRFTQSIGHNLKCYVSIENNHVSVYLYNVPTLNYTSVDSSITEIIKIYFLMGVNGLWKLIEPVGKPIPLESLENKVLAVGILDE